MNNPRSDDNADDNAIAEPQSPKLLSGFSVVLCTAAVIFNAFATYCITSAPHS